MQTTINPSGQPQAVAGQRSDNSPVFDAPSRINAEATTRMSFGIGVKVGTKDHETLMLSSNADVVQGVVVFDYDHSPGTFGDIDTTSTPPGLKPKAQFNMARKGRLWVQVDAGVASIAAGVDRAYCRCTANGGNTVVGAFSNAADGANSIDVRKQAVFVSGLRVAADGTKIAELEVDFANAP